MFEVTKFRNVNFHTFYFRIKSSQSPEEGHPVTESARDVTFITLNPRSGVCAWPPMNPCLR
jgi:hypothetical protein